MAYATFADVAAGGAEPCARTADPLPTLSPLEWTVVALARRDRPSSLAAPTRLGRALRWLFGGWRDPRLADPRLEALRRIAVLSWRHGYTVTSAEVRAFVSAGWTAAQYEAMVDGIGAMRRVTGRAAAGRPLPNP